MLGELVPQGGGDSIPLHKPKLMIGRRDGCDICLRFPNVSSHHCELELTNGYWRVRDLGSSNGIKVNGVRVNQKWVFPGDELSVAKHHFTIAYTPPTGVPPPVDEENIQMSLMEKAGLLKRSAPPPPSRSERRPQSGNPPAAPARQPPPKSDDEQALEWLQGDEPG